MKLPSIKRAVAVTALAGGAVLSVAACDGGHVHHTTVHHVVHHRTVVHHRVVTRRTVSRPVVRRPVVTRRR